MDDELRTRLDRIDKRLNFAITYICVTLVLVVAAFTVPMSGLAPNETKWIVLILGGGGGALLAGIVLKRTA